VVKRGSQGVLKVSKSLPQRRGRGLNKMQLRFEYWPQVSMKSQSTTDSSPGNASIEITCTDNSRCDSVLV